MKYSLMLNEDFRSNGERQYNGNANGSHFGRARAGVLGHLICVESFRGESGMTTVRWKAIPQYLRWARE